MESTMIDATIVRAHPVHLAIKKYSAPNCQTKKNKLIRF